MLKQRRNELNLTIEQAALKAGVGTKTWSRYEAGESIRKDKCRGICNALGLKTLPNTDTDDTGYHIDFADMKKNEAWSEFIEESFGTYAAASFVIGCEILYDDLCADMEILATMPKGSRIGQIDISALQPYLPTQFLMNYDYDFLYVLFSKLQQIQKIANSGTPIIAHSVLDELLLYLIIEEARFLMESVTIAEDSDDIDDYDNWDEWIFDLFDDTDIILFLYSDIYLTDDNIYHFSHWLENQFYCS